MPHHDLLHSYLSGAASPAEVDVLDAALAGDAALAAEFAEAARIEAHLAAHFASARPMVPLVAELQRDAHSPPASPADHQKGGQRLPAAVSAALRLQPVLAPPAAPPVAEAQARRGQPGAGAKRRPPQATTDLPSSNAARAAARRRHRPWLRAAAALLLALGLLAATTVWITHRPGAASPVSDATPTPPRRPFPPALESNTTWKRPAIEEPEETPEMRALRRRLENYHLTDIGLEQAIPLSEALQRLLSRARALNHLHRSVIETLSLAPAEDQAVVDASRVSVRLPKKSLSLMDALRLAALQAGCDIRLDPPGLIRLQPLPDLDSWKLVTRTLRVSPDFVSSRIDPADAATTAGLSLKDRVHQNAVDLARQTRKEISDYALQLESIKDKQGGELVAAAANLGIQEPTSSAIYSLYLADQTKLKQWEQLGAGPRHPDIVALQAGIEEGKRQLVLAAGNIRNALETKLANAKAVLANMETITEETRQAEGKADTAGAEANAFGRMALEDFGIAFPENTAAVFNPATSTLTVTHTEGALRQIEAILAVGSRRVSTMINAQTKLFEFANGHALENRLMDAAAFQLWLREQQGIKGVDLLTAPSITTRAGQNARVEVMREVAGLPEPDWSGVRVDVYPTMEGETVRLTGSAEVRRPRDSTPGQLPWDPATQPTELVSTAVDVEAIIPPGQTALFSLSENPDGPHLLAAITLQLMDPSGQAIRSDGAGEIK